MIKTKQDNNITDHIGMVYADTETELSVPIWPTMIYDENHTEQQRDRLYRCGLHWKWNRVVITDQIECSL